MPYLETIGAVAQNKTAHMGDATRYIVEYLRTLGLLGNVARCILGIRLGRFHS
jgi:hypothetical protein